jgi:hypothetical protein
MLTPEIEQDERGARPWFGAMNLLAMKDLQSIETMAADEVAKLKEALDDINLTSTYMGSQDVKKKEYASDMAYMLRRPSLASSVKPPTDQNPLSPPPQNSNPETPRSPSTEKSDSELGKDEIVTMLKKKSELSFQEKLKIAFQMKALLFALPVQV